MRKEKRVLFILLVFFLLGTNKAIAFEATTAAPSGTKLCVYFNLKRGYKTLTDGVFPENASSPVFLDQFSIMVLDSFNNFKTSAKLSLGNESKNTGKNWINSQNEFQTLISSLKDVKASMEFEPDGLFCFFKNPQEFTILLTGKIKPEFWKSSFTQGTVLPRKSGFSVLFEKELTSINDQIILHFSNNFAFLCPASLEGNILDNIDAGRNYIKENWPTFYGLSLGNPQFVLEMDAESLIKTAEEGSFNIPFPINSIKVLRILFGRDLIKAQAFSTNDEALVLLNQGAKVIVDALKAFLEKSDFAKKISDFFSNGLRQIEFSKSLRSYTTGHSVFIDGTGLGESCNLLEVANIAIFSSIFFHNLDRAKKSLESAATKQTDSVSSAVMPQKGAAEGKRSSKDAKILVYDLLIPKTDSRKN